MKMDQAGTVVHKICAKRIIGLALIAIAAAGALNTGVGYTPASFLEEKASGIAVAGAHQDRVIGGQLFSAGGEVQVEVAPAGFALYTSELWLFEPGPPQFIATNRDAGLVVNLGPFDPGVELVFGIVVRETGWTFKMGPGERNPDGIPHAAVEFIAEGEAIVGFEDLYGGGDRDYDDVVFIFRGSIVPEQCGNGVDDDRDGLIDCEDADCAGVGECGENCENNRDDDGDGLVDCLDADCFRGCAGIGRCRNWPRITSLFPIQGANIGSVTVTLGCCNVQEGASIYLDGPGGEIPGQNLGIFSTEGSSTVQISFDLRGKLPGVYDIHVNNPDTTYTFLRGAFTITQGSGRTATPWLDVASREVFRMGRAQRINIFYGNSGTVDTSAKLIFLSVSGDEQAWLQTDVFDIPRSELVLLAGSLMGEALSLGAGQSWTLPVIVEAPNMPGELELQARMFEVSGSNFPWEALPPPRAVSPETWQKARYLLQQMAGSSWDSVLQFLLRSRGQGKPLEVDKALAFASVAAVWSVLLSDTLSAPKTLSLHSAISDIEIEYLSTRESGLGIYAVGSITENPSRAVIITHGLGGMDINNPEDRFVKLGVAVKQQCPDCNVFILNWTPLATISSINGWKTDPWWVGANGIPPAASLLRNDLRNSGFGGLGGNVLGVDFKEAGYIPPDRTIMIGESFGNKINEILIDEYLGSVSRVLACNPASEGSLVDPPNFLGKADLSVGFHTFSLFDTQQPVAQFDLLLQTREGMDDVGEHTFGVVQLGNWVASGDVRWLFGSPEELGLSGLTRNVYKGYEGFVRLDGFVEELPSPLPSETLFIAPYAYAALKQAYENEIKRKVRRVRVVGSMDPNDKAGPLVASPGEPLAYTIFFENLETATAPAQEVVIEDQLDPEHMDLRTFALGPIMFGRWSVTPPPGAKSYSTTLDLRPDQPLLVQIEAGLDTVTARVTWRLTSIDPETGELPEDPFAGFLPPNVRPPEGDGSVSFTIAPRTLLLTDWHTCNNARIVFDQNPAIETPVICTQPPEFGFTLSPPNPTHLHIMQGGMQNFQITLTPKNGFSGIVSLMLVDQSGRRVPGITIISTNPAPVQVLTDSIVVSATVMAASDITPGTYNLQIQAISGSIARWQPLTVMVTERARRFQVTRNDDATDATLGDGICADGNGACSLRAAVMEANALGGGPHTIVLQAGQAYNLSLDAAVGEENGAAEDDLDIIADIIIQGNGATVQRDLSLTCNANSQTETGEFRIFDVQSGGRLTLQNVTVRNGCADGVSSGGGIRNAGRVIITNSTFADNVGGGALYNEGGTIYASFVTIVNNSGGVIQNGPESTVHVKNSIIANNIASNCSGSGTLNAFGVNFATDSSCGSNFTVVSADELNLQPLANDDGFASIFLLGPSSAAVDAVTDCTDLDNNLVTMDQRGMTRPQGNACDAGAVEREVPVAIEELKLPTTLAFYGHYPNPVRSDYVVLVFDLPVSAQAQVVLYDVLGRQVRRWSLAALSAGARRQVPLYLGSLAVGLYIYQVQLRLDSGKTQSFQGRLVKLE